MKNLFNYVLIFLIICIFTIMVLLRQLGDADRKWKVAMGNVKAYAEQLSNAENKSTTYQMTIGQMKYYQDSILKELDSTRKQLKVKDKNVKSIQYVASTFIKRDTIVAKDTIFKEPAFIMDTLLYDNWYSVRIGLSYPSTVTVEPQFKSEKHIVVSTKKETVNPPKKFFLFRWLQKKHTVLKVNVVEKNPYVQNEDSRYVEIIK